jgi:phage shock protein A
MNKFANFLFGADPIAQLQYEYDKIVDQMKEGRVGLEQYRALVERVERQVSSNLAHVANLEARIKTHLRLGERDRAAPLALELQKAKASLAENEGQLRMHEEAYGNNLLKVKHATGKLTQLREKINKYDADLKLSRAEAEVAKIATSINVDVTTDFGEIEQVLQDEIDRNRARAKVAADLSGEGLEDVKREIEMEKTLADDALRDFEQQMGRETIKQF